MQWHKSSWRRTGLDVFSHQLHAFLEILDGLLIFFDAVLQHDARGWVQRRWATFAECRRAPCRITATALVRGHARQPTRAPPHKHDPPHACRRVASRMARRGMMSEADFQTFSRFAERLDTEVNEVREEAAWLCNDPERSRQAYK